MYHPVNLYYIFIHPKAVTGWSAWHDRMDNCVAQAVSLRVSRDCVKWNAIVFNMWNFSNVTSGILYAYGSRRASCETWRTVVELTLISERAWFQEYFK
jgi:hypothetical protein